jgi:hypothetical protein
MPALITILNNPSVKIFIGRDKTFIIGLMNRLKSPNRSPARNAILKLSQTVPADI